MNRRRRTGEILKRGLLLAGVLWGLCGSVAETIPVQVTGDRVNLRAQPSLKAETVGQVQYEEVLQALDVGTNWVQLVPPEEIDCYIHRDFIVDGVVKARKLNARSGPGINYKVLGELNRGDQPEIRGEFGEWLRIAPPENASVWVSREFIEPVHAVGLEAVGAGPHEAYQDPMIALQDVSSAPKQEQAQAPAAPAIKSRPRPQLQRSLAIPPDWELIPLEGQGKTIQQEGTLKTVGFIMRKPAKYRLIRYEDGRSMMLCYVYGNVEQLAGYLNQELILTGREYWVQGYRYPVLVLEKITTR